jgi:hypothetical protein
MKRMLVMFAGLALAATAATATAGSGSGKGIDYAAYATGEQLQEIKFFELYNWQRSTSKEVVLWTKPSEAYLVSLKNTCEALRSGNVVIQVGGVGGFPGRLRTNDDLIVGQMKCKVDHMRALDLKAMKADRKA